MFVFALCKVGVHSILIARVVDTLFSVCARSPLLVSTEQDHSLADAFEYVMYGKIYRLEGDDGPGGSGKL